MKIARERSVFINCPYDPEFAPLFDAIVFATVSCGFIPRSALETGTVAEPRMERIVQALFSSGYSIHDLSRCKGDGAEGLARFNMPLELGIAMALRYLGRGKKKQPPHDWLLLVPTGHHYLKFVSDLGAWDPQTHDSTVGVIVPRVMSWLAGRPGVMHAPTPKAVLAALPTFQAEMEALTADWQAAVPWSEVLKAAGKRVPRVGLPGPAA